MTDPRHRWAVAALGAVEARSTGAALDRALRVTLNFHPDRLLGERTVLARLTDDGRYRSQFETGTSNGGLTAHPGGARWRWEARLFDAAYDDAPAWARPVYGALNHRVAGLGAAPRFGSAHLRLCEHTLDRTTFCFPDSVFEPVDVGTATRCSLLALADVFAARPSSDAEEAAGGGPLDAYVEAQVHGGVTLADDVEALVLDPSHLGTQVERDAVRTGLAVEYHEGRRLSLATLEQHPEFRGPEVVAAGRRIAEDGMIDAATLGRAARRGGEDASCLKRLWHHVARFGEPATC